ncbi:3'-5' exoribonuclease [Providencia rettgeri]|nr:3'-5' exoribonuclease [Providencia rettgeri]
MLDLETMGTKPTAAIVAIGAVFFNPETGELGSRFYKVIKLSSSMMHEDTTVDAETIIWWMKQSSEARSEIITGGTSIISALRELSEFINESSISSSLKVWGNGSSFDNVILRSTYERYDRTAPWMFYNDRDIRTIVDIGRSFDFDPKVNMPFDGVQHNALADAIHQAKYVSAIWQRININKESI